jgi:hypothetical protein
MQRRRRRGSPTATLTPSASVMPRQSGLATATLTPSASAMLSRGRCATASGWRWPRRTAKTTETPTS